mmetsp:Transcript_44591/g.39827  ORF Transcript_44591/g.39827 Transcript_44591/m.39827 type:complete len:485 (-) Transcript_44591:177-1631(-)
MIMSTIALILFATLSINGDRQNSARQYAQKPRGQMGFKWTRQYARQGSQGFGSSNYGNPINTEQPQPQYPYGKGTAGGFGSAPSNTDEPATSSTENTETTTSPESTEEPVGEPTSNTEEEEEEGDDIDTTDEPETIMNCLNDKCAESFNACFEDEQCKEWMEEWQETQSLKPECLPTYSSTTFAPETEELDEEAFETTADGDFESTENTESTTSNTENTYNDYDESTSTSSTENTESGSTENTYDEDAEPSFSYSSTETEYSTSSTEQESECEYNELFWNAYNCGVENYCYADQLKLAQSHQYLVQSPSNYRVEPNVTGSKSSSHGSTLLIVAVTSGIAAIILFEVSRRLYAAFQDKIQCQCSCVTLNNGLRYIKNKLEQVRGYKYEKTHADLDAIEESDDMGMYGTSSDKEESITKDTTGVTYNGPLNDDSDISDDIELQKTEDNMNNDDQFLHNDTVSNEEEKDTEEEEITVEAVQEPIQEL